MTRPGATGAWEAAVGEEHTAHALGNEGVHVLATPVATHFCALAARRALAGGLAEGEAAVPRRCIVAHLRASPRGARIRAFARVTAVEGREVTLAVEAQDGEGIIMSGTHVWTVGDCAALAAGEAG